MDLLPSRKASPIFGYLDWILIPIWFSLTAAATADTVTGDVPEISPNELGEIMVLMYHGIGERESTWVRSRANFKSDLDSLYREGYRPVSLSDLVRNHIETPAGYSPVVLTFDDGREDNFRVIVRDGKPTVDPDSAVGILEEFHREHPDFPLEATFFLNGTRPFGQSEWVSYKLNHLVALGMDVGNHTTGHQDLARAEHGNPLKIQQYIGAERDFLENNLTEHQAYRIELYALCKGHRPRKTNLHRYLAMGKHRGRPYRNIAILNVGSRPAPSPADRDFDPMSIPRIRASDHKIGNYGIGGWTAYFRKRPDKRYVSDGDPDTITIPRSLLNRIVRKESSKRIIPLESK